MTFGLVGELEFIKALTAARKESARVRMGCLFQAARVYGDGRCFLSGDRRTGFVITAEGELVSLFNTGAPGFGAMAVELARGEGATHLKCSERLVGYYRRFGFQVCNVEMRLNKELRWLSP